MSRRYFVRRRFAFRLAQGMVRAAGAIHPPRAAEWHADLAFLQNGEAAEPGLAEAFSCLVAAPRLSCRGAIRHWLPHSPLGEAELVQAGVPSSMALASRLRYLGPDFGDWVRACTEAAGWGPRVAESIYTVGNCFAGDPFHVTFLREPDGSLRGLELMGAEECSLAVSIECLARFQDRLERCTDAVTVLSIDQAAALLALAERATPYFAVGGDDGDEVVVSIAFNSGSPMFPRGMGV